MDFNISYTFLSTYKKCQKRAYLQYVKRVIDRDKVDHRPFIVGLVADWLFRKWVEADYPRGWMEKKADEMFDWFARKKNIRYKGGGDKIKLKQKLKKSVRLLENCTYSEGFLDKKVEVNKFLEQTLNGIHYVGKLDIWFPDEQAIWDLKITATTRYLDVFQLYFFAWLMEQVGGKVKEVAFFSPLMSPYVRRPVLTADKIIETKEEVDKLLVDIKRGKWNRTAKDCWGCPVQRYCDTEKDIVRFKRKPSGGFVFDLEE